MKVCFFTHSFRGVCCGVTRYSDALIDGLLARGHDITVVTGTVRPGGEANDRLWIENVGADRWDSLHGNRLGRRRRYRSTWSQLTALRSFDLLHFVEAADIWPGCARGVPVVANVHGYQFLDAPKNPLALRKQYKDWLTRWFYQTYFKHLEMRGITRTDCVLVHSRFVSSRVLARLPRARVRTISIGIFQPWSPKSVARPQKAPGERFEILFVGSNFEGKGLRTLLNAAAIINKQGHDVHLTVMGRDRHLLRYATKARTIGCDVTFAGQLLHDRVTKLYQQADMFVLPSRVEAFGLVLLEAMRHGLPVIGSNVGGIPEIIRDGWNGLLVPEGDATALAERLLLLIRDHELRCSLAINGLQTTAEYTITRMAQETEALYKELLAV